jgi:hypothetical protein
MAHFEATVRVFDVIEADASAARRAIDERLRMGGFTRWQVVNVSLQGAITRALPPPRPRAHPRNTAGVLLFAAIFAWVLWLLWVLAG